MTRQVPPDRPVRPVLRIVSWNIRAGGGRRVELITDQLRSWGADLVALSEFRATPPSEYLKGLLGACGLRFQASTADHGVPAANRLLIASRWPLRVIRLRSAPLEPGRWCAAHIAAARPFTLGVMHVPNRVTGRKDAYHAAVLDIARSWRRGPALLVGDTNSGCIGIDEEVPCFSKREDGWIAALEEAGWRDGFRHLRRDTRAYTWYSPNGRNGFRIDQAFVNRSLLPQLVDARYEWALCDQDDERRGAISDHAAMVVDLDA
jgi:exonuclease III